MTLSPDDRKALAIDVAAELAPMISTCGCGLSDAAKKEMPHLIGMIKDLGHGDYAAGVETLRANNKIMSRFQMVSEWVGRAVVGAMVLGFLGIAWCIIKAGLKVNLFDVVK